MAKFRQKVTFILIIIFEYFNILKIIFQNTFDEDIIFLLDSFCSSLFQKLVFFLQAYTFKEWFYSFRQSVLSWKLHFLKNNIQGHPQKTCTENIQCRYAICLAYSVWGLHSTTNSILTNSPDQLYSSKIKVKLAIIFIWKFAAY